MANQGDMNKTRRKLISAESQRVKFVLNVVSVWQQYVMYLELTRSKSVTSGSQPALHSYLNKPRRSRGKRETLKPFCRLLVTLINAQ